VGEVLTKRRSKKGDVVSKRELDEARRGGCGCAGEIGPALSPEVVSMRFT
jgi:hypothetical protein